MLSAFGIVSIVIAPVCVGALILHFCVMKRRVVLDKRLAVLDDLLHARLEMLYDTQSAEVCEICADIANLETRKLLKSIARIKIEQSEGASREALQQNIAETEAAADAYNEAAAVYNDYIAKFPAKIMALVLGMGQEKEV
ncbi:MAG: hypothetical protein FWF80_03700 [Defluviitaleaceae bacterium]|nr:hypothetical protein [Defluviitaleaceae bacterium]